MNLQLENKLALVTGSTAGIGFAIAKALAAEGARVIVNGRTQARVTEAIASIRGHIPSARLDGLALDLSKADAAMQTIKRFPDVDILVNNLGVYQLKPFEQITDAEWSDIIETNVLRGKVRHRHGEIEKRHDCRSGKGVLPHGKTKFSFATLCYNRRSRGAGCIRSQSAFFRDKRRGVAGGRRCGALDSLKTSG